MFGLLELSRQRLRSSLIDKTFDKCNYCNGTGLILNSNAISDQIINVIREKISEKQNISVKCNTSLAETLINNKTKEITELENVYKSKITFIFDNQFSLHEPSVEIQGKIKDINIDSNVIKKNKSKKKIIKKKKRVLKKSETKKTSRHLNKTLQNKTLNDKLKEMDVVRKLKFTLLTY
jgi:ribonuclease E